MTGFLTIMGLSLFSIAMHAMDGMHDVQEKVSTLSIGENSGGIPALTELCMRKAVEHLGATPERLLASKNNEGLDSDKKIEEVLEKLPLDLCQRLCEHANIISQLIEHRELYGLRDIARNNKAAARELNEQLLSVYSLTLQKLLWSDQGHDFYRACFSPDGQYLAVRGFKMLYIYRTDNGQTIAMLDANCENNSFCFDNDNNVLYVEGCRLKKYNLIEQRTDIIMDEIFALKGFFSASKTVFVERSNNVFAIIDVLQGVVTKTIVFKSFKDQPDVCAIHSKAPDYERLATVNYGLQYCNKVYIWDLTKPSPSVITTLKHAPDVHLTALAFNNPGEKIITGSDMNDHSIYVWNIEQPHAVLLTHIFPVKCPIIKLWWYDDIIFVRNGHGNAYSITFVLAKKIKEYIDKKNGIGKQINGL